MKRSLEMPVADGRRDGTEVIGPLSALPGFRKNVLQIIRNLDSNMAYGDMISIRMLKLCDDSICKPLEILFKTCLQNGRFPLEWKKPMLSLFIRKVINELSKTLVQFPFYLFVGKYLNACFMTLCLIFF